jgi:hypothetical protein
MKTNPTLLVCLEAVAHIFNSIVIYTTRASWAQVNRLYSPFAHAYGAGHRQNQTLREICCILL